MKKIISAIVAIIVIVLIVFAVKSNTSNTTPNQPIKIGGVLSLSGSAASDGESIQKGMELAKIDLKKQGIDIELIYQDDKTEPKGTVNAINAIVMQGVEAIIGPTWSYLADAGIPVSDRLKLVSLMPANTSEYVSARSQYAFFTTSKVERLVPTLTKWLTDNNKKSIALVRNQGAWYDTVAKAVQSAAKEAGAKIVFEESVPFGSEVDTIPTIIAKLKQLKIDLLFFEMDSEKGIAIVLKKAQEQGISADMISVTTALGRVLGSDVSISKLNNKFYIIAPQTSQEFKNKFTDFYGKKPGPYADRAYDSVMVLVEAIKNKGTTSLSDYLKTKIDYQGYAGNYKFDEVGDITGGDWTIESL